MARTKRMVECAELSEWDSTSLERELFGKLQKARIQIEPVEHPGFLKHHLAMIALPAIARTLSMSSIEPNLLRPDPSGRFSCHPSGSFSTTGIKFSIPVQQLSFRPAPAVPRLPEGEHHSKHDIMQTMSRSVMKSTTPLTTETPCSPSERLAPTPPASGTGRNGEQQ